MNDPLGLLIVVKGIVVYNSKVMYYYVSICNINHVFIIFYYDRYRCNLS